MYKTIKLFARYYKLITCILFGGLLSATAEQIPEPSANINSALGALQTLHEKTDFESVTKALEKATTALQTLAAIPADAAKNLFASLTSLELNILALEASSIDVHQITSAIVDELLDNSSQFQQKPIETMHKTVGNTLETALRPHHTAQQHLLQVYLERFITIVSHKIIWDPRKVELSWNQLNNCLNSINALPLPKHAATHLCATMCSKFAQFLDMFGDAIDIKHLPLLRMHLNKQKESLTRALGHTAPTIIALLENTINACEIDARTSQQELVASMLEDDDESAVAEAYKQNQPPTSTYNTRSKRRKRKRT